MSRRIRVNAGHKGITLPNGETYDGEVTVTLTDAQYEAISATAFSSNILTDLGAIADPDVDATFATDADVAAKVAVLAQYTATFTITGGLIVGVGVSKYPVAFDSTVLGVRITANESPVGSSAIVDVN